MKNKPAKQKTIRGKSYRDEAGIKKFGEKVQELRKAQNVTQEELVRRTGFDLRQIGRIERGEVNTSISHAFKIAEALGISPDVLFTAL